MILSLIFLRLKDASHHADFRHFMSGQTINLEDFLKEMRSSGALLLHIPTGLGSLISSHFSRLASQLRNTSSLPFALAQVSFFCLDHCSFGLLTEACFSVPVPKGFPLFPHGIHTALEGTPGFSGPVLRSLLNAEQSLPKAVAAHLYPVLARTFLPATNNLFVWLTLFLAIISFPKLSHGCLLLNESLC